MKSPTVVKKKVIEKPKSFEIHDITVGQVWGNGEGISIFVGEEFINLTPKETIRLYVWLEKAKEYMGYKYNRKPKKRV